MGPLPVLPLGEMEECGYVDKGICDKADACSAKELAVVPGAEVVIKDRAAYGMSMMQGHGTMGVWNVETPSLIRYGQLTNDEFFVSEQAAREGVRIVNTSENDPIVMLKHFGPGNPDLEILS